MKISLHLNSGNNEAHLLFSLPSWKQAEAVVLGFFRQAGLAGL
jgi:hypothetical protein